MLLALAERCRKVAETLAAHIADRRDLLRITHTVADVLRVRMLAIGCGYPGLLSSGLKNPIHLSNLRLRQVARWHHDQDASGS